MSGFGRDEMNAMIGRPQGSEGVEETAGLRQSKPKHQSSSRRTANEEVDISKLTAAETAALLMKKANMGSSNHNATSVVNNTSRYRTKNKVLDHHQLLAELSQQQAGVAIGKDDRKDKDDHDNNNGSDSDDEFVRQRRPAQAPVVISRACRNVDKDFRRRRRAYDSSSSEESSNSGGKRTKRGISKRRRQRDGGRGGSSSSSSSSDEEDDRRRQNRVLASRKGQKEPEIIIPELNPGKKQEENHNSQPEESVHVSEQKQDQSQMERIEPKKATKAKIKSRNTSSSDDDDDDGNDSYSSESSSESDSSSSSSSSEEEAHVGLKPVFVPKHKRNVIKTEEKKWEEEETQLQREKELNQKRKMESRALVAKQSVAIESSFTGEDDVDEESRGATNAPPNDDDEIDRDKEEDAWELREMERLLESMDQQLKLKKEEEEYNRRKKLTDAECLREDTESGRYQAPGAARKSGTDQKPTESNHLQKFFHRGAFYMDESEWGEGDIREKAGEYAKAATGEDKVNKAKLPEVMQVKNFGLAKQNTK